MEPDVACLAKDLRKNDISPGLLIADDNAAAIKLLREEVNDRVGKWADLSHAKTNFNSKLNQAKHQHRELKNKKVAGQFASASCTVSKVTKTGQTSKGLPSKV